MKTKKQIFKNLPTLFQNSYKAIVLFVVLFAMQTNVMQAQCNQLIWADEFNGVNVDASKWQSISGNGCPGLCGFGNAEAQKYDPNQATILKDGANSYLKIEAKYNAASTTEKFTSAKLTTEGKFAVKYGRIEARMKLSSGLGAWPAFWMLPVNGSWPYTGEIDIMEAKHKNPKQIGGTIHYDAGGYHYTYKDYNSVQDLSQDFHVYAVEWGPDVIKWYVDNTLFHTATPKTTTNGGWPFNDSNFFIILNLAVGSAATPYTNINGVGVAPNPADFPTNLLVDYVRVYSGSYTFGVFGDAKVYNNQANKNYSVTSIPNATYNWTVPAGATITAGQGTNSITVRWGTTGGNVAVTTSVASCTGGNTINNYKLAVTTEAAFPVERNFENFQTSRLITYAPTTTGALTQAIANPSATGSNTSALVGKYVRNTAEKYDVLYVRNMTITNANDFVAGRKRVSLDIYANAPLGSKITMQFENSAITTSTNYPTGRHSSYVAYTTAQNKWETLDFELERIIDAGTSPFAINNVVFLFEPNSNSGSTYHFDNLIVRAEPVKPILATDVLENYDGIRLITKGLSTGVYTADVANPGANTVNGSAKAARYVRNASELYDVLFFSTGTNIKDAGLFKNHTYKLLVDVYSTAAVGTVVSLNFENSAASLPTNYPTGRNSSYQAVTTKQNQWETLTFSYASSPDAATSNLTINQIVFLFNSGLATGNTFYIDNIRIAKTKLPDTYTVGAVYEDYQSIHNITYNGSIGTYTPTIANPSATGINTSANVGRYVRNAGQLYDNISFGTTINNVSDFKKETKKFALDLYTSAPVGTVISWQLESSALSTPSNYPSGRHSIYQAVVEKTNAWQTVVFTYASSPDTSTLDTNVNRFVFLFNPGSNTGDTYFIDNIRSLNIVGTTPTPVSTNVAFQKQATASTIEAPGLAANNSTDADKTGSRWASSFANPSEWIYVDLANRHDINRVVLRWEAAFAVNYEIQVSDDFNNWTGKTIRTVNGSDGAIDDLTVTGTGRYVRILCNQKALAPYGYSLFDIEVYGVASAARFQKSDEIATVEDIKVFPNPVNGLLTVLVPNDGTKKQMIIYGLSGSVVLQKVLEGKTTEEVIDVSQLNTGVYMMKVSANEKVWNKRIIKN